MRARSSRRFRWATGVLLLAGVSAGPQTQPADPQTRETIPQTQPETRPSSEIAELIGQLADARWQVRNRAADRLVELGDSAVPQLRAAHDATSSVDFRARAAQAMLRIRDARRSGPTYLTLHLNSVPPRAAFDAIAEQSHLTFDSAAFDSPDPKPISIDIDHRPLWVVLREVCSKARLEVASISPAGLVTLQPGDAAWGDRPASIAGPFMLVAHKIDMTRSLDFTRPQNPTNSYTLSVLAYAEPKLHPIYWAVRSIDQCVTETGRQLEQQQDEPWEVGDLNAEAETQFTFTAPADSGRRLAKLRLTARFVLSEKSQTLDVADLINSKSETRNVAGWRVLLKGVTKNDDDRYTVAITVYRDSHDPDEWNERVGLLDRAQPRLLDAAGKTLEVGGNSLNEGPDEWNWSDEFAVTGDSKPTKLSWDFPLQTRHSDVSFEFNDLPLP